MRPSQAAKSRPFAKPSGAGARASHRDGANDADARNCHEPLGGLIVARAFAELSVEEPNLLSERADVREQDLAQGDDRCRQAAAAVLQSLGKTPDVNGPIRRQRRRIPPYAPARR